MEDKQEQIEKMAYSICTMGNVAEYITDCSKCGYNDEISCKRLKYARKFLEKGYRKASDVIDEFVERMKGLLNKHEHRSQIDGVPFYQMNAESFCDEINEIADKMKLEIFAETQKEEKR